MKKAAKKAAKANGGTAKAKTPKVDLGEPAFPYTTVPNALRKFLKVVPEKPKPSKVNNSLLDSYGLSGSNSNSIIRVLKTIGMLNGDASPTELYVTFMRPQAGPLALAQAIREVYAPLFESSHTPYKQETSEMLRTFRIHSGGGENTLNLQAQTFKTLCEFADFEGTVPNRSGSLPPEAPSPFPGEIPPGIPPIPPTPPLPSIHIDLHIHLPENKSQRDYQAIIEDIGRYIYRLEESPNV